jgi:CheY-like chemotaxis protein
MSGARVLVVDDNAMNLKLVAAMLAAGNYDIHTAGNADEALASLGQARPALILMDLQMPGIDGFELTRRLKADPATHDIPIIAVTAFAMKHDELRARAAGCDDYISKPIDRQLLREAVARHLAASAAR